MDSGIPQYAAKKYWPMIKAWMATKEYKAWWKSEMDVMFGPTGRGIMEKADRLARDFGGWDRDRLYRGNGYTTGMPPTAGRSLGDLGDVMRKTTYWGHMENSDIKDIAEDVVSILKDYARLYRLNKEPAKTILKTSAALRWTPEYQKFEKSLKTEDWSKVGALLMKWGKNAKRCPKLQRLTNSGDRLFRTFAREIKIKDLPTGMRDRWVNDFLKGMKWVLKSKGDPVKRYYKMMGKLLKCTIKNMIRFHMKADAIQRSYKPKEEEVEE
jgi:hypothetical protein